MCRIFLFGGSPSTDENKVSYNQALSNRSELEWVIDQYRVKSDKRSGIINDPNRPDDPQYTLRLIDKVITVSLKTMKFVANLPELKIAGSVVDGEGRT